MSKNLIDKIIQALKFIRNYGVSGIVTIFTPVHWIQDIDFNNNGYDTWSFKKSGYFYGTYIQRNNWLDIH